MKRLDPQFADSPNRFHAHGRVRGIAIGLNLVMRVTRAVTAPEREAMLWLTNYAHLLDVTAETLSAELALSRDDIRRALTDPDADRTAFILAVKRLRERFEAPIKSGTEFDTLNPFQRDTVFGDAYQPLVDTAVRRKVRNAVRFGCRSPQIIEVIGKTRMGKSVAAAHEYLRRLDHAAWLHCPRTGHSRDFFTALAHAVGVTVSGHFNQSQLMNRLMPCFGRNGIRLLFVDEGHRLWPTNLRDEPKRIEFLRDLWETRGVSSVICATKQYSNAMMTAMEENSRWAPGQWDGRVQRFHLRETMSDDDLMAVAIHHLPAEAKTDEEIVLQLVEQAKSSEGFCGAMVNAIRRAAFMAELAKQPLTLRHIKSAQAELVRSTRLERIALAAHKPKKGKRA